MNDLAARLTFFLIVCMAVSMVIGAMRATSLHGVVRESLKSFVALAGGIALLVVCVELVLSVAQAQG